MVLMESIIEKINLSGYGTGAGILIFCTVAGLFVFLRERKRPLTDRLSVSITPLLVSAALCLVIYKILKLPFVPWNHAQIVTTFGLPKGFNYFAQTDGPVLSWMYGPLGALAFFPSALFSNPSAGICIAGGLSFVFFMAPILFLLIRLTSGIPFGKSAITFCSYGFIITFLSISSPALSGTAISTKVNSPMIFFAGLSVVLLVKGTSTGKLRFQIISAVLIVLGVFTKQTVLPLAVILSIYVYLAHGKKVFFYYSGTMVLTALFLLAGLYLWCGSLVPAGTLALLPAKYHWVSIIPGDYNEYPLITGVAVLKRARALIIAFIELLVLAIPFLLIAIAGNYVSAKGETRKVSFVELWKEKKESILFVFVLLASIPLTLVGRVKLGGWLSHYAMPCYFLLLWGISIWGGILTKADNRSLSMQRIIRNVNYMVLGFSASAALLTILKISPGFGFVIKEFKNNSLEQAYRFSKAYPDQAYFPHFPLATFMTDHKVYHSAYGLWDLENAGITIDSARYFEHLPSKMQYLCFHKDTRYDKSETAERLAALRGFYHPVAIAGMDDWIIFTRKTP